MRYMLAAGLTLPLIVSAGVALAQSHPGGSPSEREIACQLGATECPASPVKSDTREDDGSMVVEGGQRPFCLPGMACARATSMATAPIQRAVGTRGGRPDPLPGRVRLPGSPLRAVHSPAPRPSMGAPRPIGTADMALTFANNSAELSTEARDRIATFARVLSSGSLSSATFRIDGHTNSIGTRQSNQDLSRRRAQAVVDYLASLGVGRDRLQAEGHGFDVPLPGTATQNPANRRVEIVRK